MRSMRLRFLLPLLATPVLVQAQAPLVYMQFGSFESKAEAEDRLTQVGKDHAGLLGSIPMGIREVAIAEDLLVYRTQAGPVESRGAAQSMCAQLASNGDACYIVETAIQQVRPVAPKPVAEAPAAEPLEETVERVARGTGLKPMPAELDEAVQDLRAAAEQMPEDVEVPAVSNERLGVVRDQRNLQTLAQVTGQRPVVTAPAVRAPEISSDMEAALAQAAQAAPRVRPTEVPSFREEKEESGSFWDAVNPFGASSDAPAVAEAAPETRRSRRPTIVDAVDDAEEQAAEQLHASSQQVSEEIARITQQAEAAPVARAEAAPLAMPTLDNVRQDLPRASIDDIINNSVPTTPKPSVDAGLPLPAPPLPKLLANKVSAQAPVQTGVPVNAIPVHIEPVQTRAVPPAHIPTFPAPSQGTTTVTAVLPDGGAVQVEEAQRVPLSGQEVAVEVAEEEPRRPVVAYAGPSGVLSGELPSQSRLHKTVWAQLNYFDTAQQALGFWDGFRRTHPDFPVVRVRVTKPYNALPTAKDQYSLRVGPFGNGRFIGQLCDSDPVDDQDLECRSMGDLGLSANHKLDSQSAKGVYSPARYGVASKGIEALDGFWVQLGAYPSIGHAEQGWEDMQKEYSAVLSSMKAQVSTPSLGSQARAVYRLRAGPFVNQEAAEEICTRLQEEQASCLVVAESKG